MASAKPDLAEVLFDSVKRGLDHYLVDCTSWLRPELGCGHDVAVQIECYKNEFVVTMKDGKNKRRRFWIGVSEEK